MNSSANSASHAEGWRKRRWRAGWSVGLIALCGSFVGCQTPPQNISLLQHEYRPDNTYAYPPKLPLELQRVAMLPLATESTDGDLPEGCEALTPVLWEQLVKTKKFEVVAVDAEKLRSRTGRAAWTGTENLPPDFFAFLRREYGCDAVFFAELTTYHAYAPLAIGWRLKLADTRTGQIIWAADELFDARRPAMAKAASAFEHPRSFFELLGDEKNWVALNSPRQFGRYSAAALLETLPER
jgi:hypothetical protein